MPIQNLTCDILVIGSGPGGALTAALLAEAGRDVLLVEEGPHISSGRVPSYSLDEMELKYRHGGLTVSMGDPKVAYLEACCVGGASEINAALYQRPLAQTLGQWVVEYQIKDFSMETMEPMFKANEAEMSIVPWPGGVPAASARIRDGAKALGWQSVELPRMWDYRTGKRQSMTETFIPRFMKAKGRLLPGKRIRKLLMSGGRASAAIADDVRIGFNHVFVCAGAIQTPLLLRRSGITRNIGNSLRMHPAVRVVARFDVDVFDNREGVPVYQVSEFKPGMILGGSYSGKPHMALWLAGHTQFSELISTHKRMAIFYALIAASAQGTVRPLPFADQPLVSLKMAPQDWSHLREGLSRLEQLLKSSGAVEVLTPTRIDLSTVHLFSSCPMGESLQRCAVDSYGKVHELKNVYISDASIIPTAPGVGPQALIMALARRNCGNFLRR